MNEVNTVRVSNITLLETKSSPCGYRYEVIVRAIAINAESKEADRTFQNARHTRQRGVPIIN